MSTPHTREQFLELVAQSGLLPSDVLRSYPRSVGEGPDGARVLADRMIRDRLLTAFQVRQLLQGKIRGFFLVDRYKVLTLLSTGATGPVILAENLRTQKLAAIKLLQKMTGEDTRRAALERFVRETRESGILDHPNIVCVQEIDRMGSNPFLVMDYVDGNSLHEIVGQLGPLPLPRAIDYIRQAAVGLHHAHGNQVAHLDIKPSHLLLDRSGVVKLIDVGLTEFLGTGLPTGEALTSGFANYVSPEQAARSPVDWRSDIYSLGAVFYFLLAARAPFENEPASTRLTAHQFREPPSIRELRPDVPSGLAEVLGRMMAKRPADRYQAMKGVVAALSPWVRDSVPPPTSDEMPAVLPEHYRLGLVSAPGQSSLSWGPLAEVRWNMSGTVETSHELNGRETRPTEAMTAVACPPEPREFETRTSRAPVEANHSSGIFPSMTPAALASPPQLAPQQAAPPAQLAPSQAGAVAAPVASRPSKPSRKGSPILLVVVGLAVLITAGAIWWLNSGVSGGQNNTGLTPKPPVGLVNPPVPGNTIPPVSNTPVTPPGHVNTVPPPKDPVAASMLLTGSGSTFIKPAMEHWIRLYEKQTGVKIKYDGIGSGRGVENMIDKVLDFGCTDAYMSEVQLAKAKAANGEVLHIPLAMGAVVVTYNLDVKAQLRFTGPVLADIYLGKITTWNHEAIAASNPGVKLPDMPITVIRRSDSSGTTSIWTDYLCKTNPEWEKKVGKGTTVKWPIGEDAEKSDGVAKAVSRKVGSLSYVELSFALERNLKFAQIKNGGENYVAPTLESVTAAANASLQSIPADLRYSLTDPPGDDSYPIAGSTWLVVYLNQPGDKGKEMVKFLKWMVHDGQDHLKDLRYAKLPPRLVKRIDEKLATIQSD